jgi:hypothetical protein
MANKSIGEQIEAESRSIKTLRQYAAAIAAGELSDDDIATMALDRVQRRLTKADEVPSKHVTLGDGGRWELFNALAVDAGLSLFPIPPLWGFDEGSSDTFPAWVHITDEEEPGLNDDPSGHPARIYAAYVQRDSTGRPRSLKIDLAYDPA